MLGCATTIPVRYPFVSRVAPSAKQTTVQDASRFVDAGGVRWHVQSSGRGPVLLMLHGTGAATTSWRELVPLLADRFTVVCPDLPGHGRSSPPSRARGYSMPGMASGLRALLAELRLEPALGVGHSAGAAILARMALDGLVSLRGLVALNGALLEFSGVPRAIFSPLARLFAATPLVPQLFAWRARDRAAVERLIASTGSRLDARGIDAYAQIVADPAHVAAALAMMANWDLGALERDLGRLHTPTLLVAGANDRTLPASESRRAMGVLPAAELVELPGLGHLAHEEAPAQVAQLILGFAARLGL